MEKIEKLKQLLNKYQSAVIAFSGGVDSTFLARIASEIYGDKLLLITATSSTYPFYELEEAKNLATLLNLNQRIIVSEEINIPGFSDNPPDRCYYCKSELFGMIKEIARKEGYEVVFDGSNADDSSDFRPGKKAVQELGIISPLAESGFTKEDIRRYSKELGLPTADKPSYACLASRFPYGEKITKDKLDRVGKAEQDIRKAGFKTFRVRSHGNLARLEFGNSEMEKAWTERNTLEKICKEAGYIYVAIDTSGYRTGAMNETLSDHEKLKWK